MRRDRYAVYEERDARGTPFDPIPVGRAEQRSGQGRIREARAIVGPGVEGAVDLDAEHRPDGHVVVVHAEANVLVGSPAEDRHELERPPGAVRRRGAGQGAVERQPSARDRGRSAGCPGRGEPARRQRRAAEFLVDGRREDHLSVRDLGHAVLLPVPPAEKSAAVVSRNAAEGVPKLAGAAGGFGEVAELFAASVEVTR